MTAPIDQGLEDAANKYVTETKGDDCLCQRTQPGTKYGEHLYIWCGCSIAEGFVAGARFERERISKSGDVLLAKEEYEAVEYALGGCLGASDIINASKKRMVAK